MSLTLYEFEFICISLRAHCSNIFEFVINMFYVPFVRMFNVFMCSFGLLAFHVFLCVFHVSACKHVRLTCAQ